MTNPILVEVTRGPRVESAHRGAIAIVDSKGNVVSSIGDIDAEVFPRSAIKALQALYLVESGAADALNLSEAELSLACSSHNGEERHVEGATNMLAKAGLEPTCLECGSQWPNQPVDRARLIKADTHPSALHNNCSGKHSGFICAGHHVGHDIEGYVKPEHKVQQDVRGILEEVYGVSLRDESICGTDGCSIPTYAAPLKAMAHGFARLATGGGFEKVRADAAKRLYDACVNEPFMVAGTKRYCTDVMTLLEGRALLKTGAEGVFAGAIPELGYGIILKCDDGTTRAAEAMMSAALYALLPDMREKLSVWTSKELKNRNGWMVGTVQVADGVTEALAP